MAFCLLTKFDVLLCSVDKKREKKVCTFVTVQAFVENFVCCGCVYAGGRSFGFYADP